MFNFFNVSSSSSHSMVFKLTPMERYFIKNFNRASDEEKMKALQEIGFSSLVRMSHLDKDFEKECIRFNLEDNWKRQWCILGITISQQKNLSPVSFYEHPAENSFNLARGAYFFSLSIEEKKKVNADFGYYELEYLKIAIQYGSVHATQRYNEYLYLQLNETVGKDSPFERYRLKVELYNTLTENSLKLVPEYGAYGYMMLAEVSVRHALWLLEENEISKAKENYIEAIEALNYAEEVLDESVYSIHNASLGAGLKSSNSFEFDTPQQAKTTLIKQFNDLMKKALSKESNRIKPQSSGS